jgi:oxygen-independent coproporphyrinogen-3 oxidase
MKGNNYSAGINFDSAETLALIRKYERPGPRYTSYPPATFFNGQFSDVDYIKHVKNSNKHLPENISFYFHVPFCPQLCHFCGCNTDIMRERTFIERYVDAIITEFETVARHLDKSRLVSQVHWGGGTPNSISIKYIRRVMDKISATFRYSPECEIAMECNPAYLTHFQMDELASAGFNRLSLGIQDFNPDVLKIINRKPSLLPEEELISVLSSKNIKVNLDFVYGLPGQTPESFEQTIRRALNLNPERLVTFSYAHVPWVKSAQKVLEQYGLPDAQTKLNMFGRAFNVALESGYVPIGLDHFAKPSDDLSRALSNHQLHRNFMGYCSRESTGQVYAFGATSISQLWDAYSQNLKNPEAYIRSVLEKGTAVEKGYSMTQSDLVCNAIIQEIMCNNRVDLNTIAQKFSVTLDELECLTHFNVDNLSFFLQDELLSYENNVLEVRPTGRLFLRNIAMVFDPLLTGKETHFSKTV